MAADDPGDDADPDDGRQTAPLGELADRIRSRQAGDAMGDAAVSGHRVSDEAFREEAYDELDADDLWETLEDDEPTPTGVEAGEQPDEYLVPKRSYCEICPKGALSEPPEVQCNHPGTAIVEFVDIDHLLVRNCPVVAERRALGEEGHGRITPETFGSHR